MINFECISNKFNLKRNHINHVQQKRCTLNLLSLWRLLEVNCLYDRKSKRQTKHAPEVRFVRIYLALFNFKTLGKTFLMLFVLFTKNITTIFTQNIKHLLGTES